MFLASRMRSLPVLPVLPVLLLLVFVSLSQLSTATIEQQPQQQQQQQHSVTAHEKLVPLESDLSRMDLAKLTVHEDVYAQPKFRIVPLPPRIRDIPGKEADVVETEDGVGIREPVDLYKVSFVGIALGCHSLCLCLSLCLSLSRWMSLSYWMSLAHTAIHCPSSQWNSDGMPAASTESSRFHGRSTPNRRGCQEGTVDRSNQNHGLSSPAFPARGLPSNGTFCGAGWTRDHHDDSRPDGGRMNSASEVISASITWSAETRVPRNPWSTFSVDSKRNGHPMYSTLACSRNSKILATSLSS